MSFQILKRSKTGTYNPIKHKPFDSFKAAATHVCTKVKPEVRTAHIIKRVEVQA